MPSRASLDTAPKQGCDPLLITFTIAVCGNLEVTTGFECIFKVGTELHGANPGRLVMPGEFVSHRSNSTISL